MHYKKYIEQVAKELNLPNEVVEYAYKSFWKFIRETIQDLPLKEDLSEEDFNKLRTNFNIPSLGKLNCTYERLKNMKSRLQYIKTIKENKDVKDKEN